MAKYVLWSEKRQEAGSQERGLTLLGGDLRKLSCTDVYSLSLLEESSLTGASVSKALPYLEAKAKGDR